LKIALLGFGTVGSGIYELIEKNKKYIKEVYNEDLVVTGVLVRNTDKYSSLKDIPFTTSFKDILDTAPDVVIEVMGGLDPSFGYVKELLNKGIHIITANKDLIAEYGVELNELAYSNNASLLYEASVGGGIPIIKPIKESLQGNQITSIIGILNGTTNFILTKMFAENLSYDDSLKLAQEAGFAEADPTSDIKGLDAARKLAIASSIAYKKNIFWKDIIAEGIDNITKTDVYNAKKFGKNIKLLGISYSENENIHCSVRPTLVPNTSAFSLLVNEFNGIEITGDAVGEVLITGKGAGKLPTGSSVYSDLLDVIQDKKDKSIVLKNDSDYNFVELYNKPSKWYVSIETDDNKKSIDKVLDYFSANKFQVFQADKVGSFFLEVEIDNEKLLKDKINKLKNKDFIHDVKYFLILE
jgi:homoserine dehydrogenase